MHHIITITLNNMNIVFTILLLSVVVVLTVILHALCSITAMFLLYDLGSD